MTKKKKTTMAKTPPVRQDTRTRLMQTMLGLIWSASYNAVSVEDICKAAGAQKGSFYHFFPSKAALVYEVFKQEWEQCKTDLDEVFSASRPAFWWALFADAGNASTTWGQMKPALGYGVGLRWRSPVGPLRIDLAYGEEVRTTRLHLSVGIAF